MTQRAPLAAILLAMLATLTACGLRPVYAGGANGAIAQGLAAVEVSPIEGREGWLVRNALHHRLGETGVDADARYRLDVALDDELEGFGLLTDDTIGRERRTLRARFQLVDMASGVILVDATAGSDAGIDVVGSEYATIAAEQTALENLAEQVADRIVTRLVLTLRESS